MLDVLEYGLALAIGPVMVGLVVMLFTYPIGQLIVEAQGRLVVQLWWTWVMGIIACIAIYAASGINLF